MAKIKLKKVTEYKTMVPRPMNEAPKGELIGKQFQLKPVEKVKMGKNGKK